MLKIGKNISSFSTYSFQPRSNEELKEIIKKRISSQGNKCDLNDIDVSLIEDMSSLFYKSRFNGDISRWNVSHVKNMAHMFNKSEFNGDISNWNVSNVEDMCGMFYMSKFNQDISKWKINEECDTDGMFFDCHIKEEYKPKSLQK